MTRFVRLPISMVIVGLLLTSCLFAGKPPTEVVKGYYAAANEGRYADGEKYLSARTRKEIIEGLGAHEQGLKFMLDEVTKDRTIDRVDFLGEQIVGDRATVDTKVLFRNGETQQGKTELVKEGGEWKVTYLPTG